MNAMAVPLATVAWKCPGTRSVLWTMMLICSVPIVTPVMPPTNPKTNNEKTRELNPGSPHGARRSQSNIPFVNPRRRIPSSMPAGTVKP